MRSTYLPSSLKSILFSFRPCFSAPSFENFTALVCGWILCPGLHTISRAIVAATGQRLAPKCHSAYYRFLSRATWNPRVQIQHDANQIVLRQPLEFVLAHTG